MNFIFMSKSKLILNKCISSYNQKQIINNIRNLVSLNTVSRVVATESKINNTANNIKQIFRSINFIANTGKMSQTTINNHREFNNNGNQRPETTLAGICHMRSINDKDNNLKQVEKIIELAKCKNVKFLFLPECCDFVGENREQTIMLSEPLNGPLIDKYKNLAKTNDMWLSFGGIHELILDSNGKNTGKIYNTHIIINENGEIVTKYRKLHLFDVDTPEFKFRESKIVSKGLEILEPINTPIGKIGLQICYDLRFPELSTILRKLGSDIITYPSAFAYTTGKAHWDVLLRARAIENQCYVIAPAQIGYHNSKRQSYGNAMIINPWGEIIAKCDNDAGDIDLSVAEIDLNKLRNVRNNMPCFEHRRDDIYSLHPLKLSSYSNEPCVNRNFSNHTILHETIFYESEYCFCFTNLRCVVPGHVLVATKRVVKRLTELLPCEITDLFQTVVKIEKYLEKFYNATSFTITVQDGVDAGQTVNHVHFHVMPRHKNDFKVNDEIYIKLQSHDHNPEDEKRPIHEMIQEAKQYRDFIKSNGSNIN